MTTTKVTAGMRTLSPGEVAGDNIGLAGQAAGDLMRFNGTIWEPVPPGPEGSVLKMVGGLPTYALALGDFVEFKSFVGVAGADLITGFDPDFPIMDFYFNFVVDVDGTNQLALQFSLDNGVTFENGASDYNAIVTGKNDANTLKNVADLAGSFALMHGPDHLGTAAGEGIAGHLRLFGPQDGDANCQAQWDVTWQHNGAEYFEQYGVVHFQVPGLVDGVRFLCDLGALLTGDVLVRRMGKT